PEPSHLRRSLLFHPPFLDDRYLEGPKCALVDLTDCARVVALREAVEEHPAALGAARVLDPETDDHAVREPYGRLGKEVPPGPDPANGEEPVVNLVLEEDHRQEDQAP